MLNQLIKNTKGDPHLDYDWPVLTFQRSEI